MSESDDLNLINGAFAELREETAPFVKPAGTRQAHATVRHQRRVRTLAAGVVTVLAVAVPVAAFATRGSAPGPGPVPGGTVTPSASPRPTHSPSPGASPRPSAAREVFGGIDAQLAHATLDLPGRGATSLCGGGRFTFRAGVSVLDGELNYTILKTVESDLDGDGTIEITALITCAVRDPSLQVVTFRPTGPGTFATMGTVVRNEPGGPVATIYDLRREPGGTVSAQVSDHQVSRAADAEHRTEPQWRTYAWRGGAFTQVDGPTTFPANQRYVDLAVTSADLVLGPEVKSQRRGVLKVTVTNNGTLAAPSVALNIRVPEWLRQTGTGCGPERGEPFVRLSTCHSGELKPGESRVIEVEFTAHVAYDNADVTQGGPPSLNVGTQMTFGETLADAALDDNSGPIVIRWQ
ncbi:hypothetical protein AB0M43_29640 [Longispora sp. NPDC051575]|uniref:hypothetical protein n=1 Tax=Longispora sp. NPDC051575 TaxID=3154943 RepID=UPI0034488C7D